MIFAHNERMDWFGKCGGPLKTGDIFLFFLSFKTRPELLGVIPPQPHTHKGDFSQNLYCSRRLAVARVKNICKIDVQTGRRKVQS